MFSCQHESVVNPVPSTKSRDIIMPCTVLSRDVSSATICPCGDTFHVVLVAGYFYTGLGQFSQAHSLLLLELGKGAGASGRMQACTRVYSLESMALAGFQQHKCSGPESNSGQGRGGP